MGTPVSLGNSDDGDLLGRCGVEYVAQNECLTGLVAEVGIGRSRQEERRSVQNEV